MHTNTTNHQHYQNYILKLFNLLLLWFWQKFKDTFSGPFEHHTTVKETFVKASFCKVTLNTEQFDQNLVGSTKAKLRKILLINNVSFLMFACRAKFQNLVLIMDFTAQNPNFAYTNLDGMSWRTKHFDRNDHGNEAYNSPLRI